MRCRNKKKKLEIWKILFANLSTILHKFDKDKFMDTSAIDNKHSDKKRLFFCTTVENIEVQIFCIWSKKRWSCFKIEKTSSGCSESFLDYFFLIDVTCLRLP